MLISGFGGAHSVKMYLVGFHSHLYMSLVVKKRVFGVSDLVRHKPGCAVTEDG